MTIVKSIFGKNYKKPAETYKGIDDMPVYNWFKINETNDLKWVLIDSESQNSTKDELEAAFERIRNEYIDTFGFPPKLKRICELQRDILVYKCDKFLTGDESFQTFIDIAELQIKELLDEGPAIPKPDFAMVVGYVERFMHRSIDEHNTSIRKFYTYLKMMEEGSAYRKTHGG